MEYISIKGAAQRLGLSEKEVNKLIQEGQLQHKTEYGLTMVTKESVYGYSGISTDAKQTKPKRGRPKGSLAKKTAAFSIGVQSDKLPAMVEDGTLKMVMQDGEERISTKSCRDYLERKELAENKGDVTDIDVGEMEVDEFCTYPECNCPFDMDADGKCLRGLLHKGQEKAHIHTICPDDRVIEYFSSPNDKGVEKQEEPLMALTDFTPVPEKEENYEIDDSTFEEAHKGVFASKPDEDVITITKRDFHASLTIAAMRAEL